jgi:hypothetical protein
MFYLLTGKTLDFSEPLADAFGPDAQPALATVPFAK